MYGYQGRWLFISFGFLIAQVGLIRASEIGESWSGASTATSFSSYQINKSDSQQGTTASSSVSSQDPTPLTNVANPNLPYGYVRSVPTSWKIEASSSADPAHLLHVSASLNAPEYTGSLWSNGIEPPTNRTSISASWSNDVVTVSNSSGSAPPDSIRLNFTLTYATPGEITPSGIRATYNGQQDSVSNTGVTGYTSQQFQHNIDGYTKLPLPIDSTTINNRDSPTFLTDTFHVDLHLDAKGQSDPLNLKLELTPAMTLVANSEIRFGTLAGDPVDLYGNLALTSVTLPDGMPLSALGDSVTFLSGLQAPGTLAAPVPEPTTFLAWGLVLSLGGLAKASRRRATRYEAWTSGPCQTRVDARLD
ncbi:hypothetical protein [Singulisphaera sp. PoT]|uniref:hypothetical protein n=1 Tax=Singulisphaera sp. PoT TaxID=3411797 RepID=UPI003BF45EF9